MKERVCFAITRFWLRLLVVSAPQLSQAGEGQSLEETKETKRLQGRIPLTLPIRVRCRESRGYEWTEQTRLVDVNHFGAGFTLMRPTEPGRLLLLTIPLPLKLRCFDYDEPQYCVWSLVRHASPLREGQDQEAVLYRVGVGFVGKRPPGSYDENPSTRYVPLPFDIGQSKMWNVSERRSDRQRRETRLIIPLEVLIEALDERGKPSIKEHTVTENVSSLGTCVPTNLDVEVGRIVRITSSLDCVSIFAAVRSRRLAPDGIPRLGLEFLGKSWPL